MPTAADPIRETLDTILSRLNPSPGAMADDRPLTLVEVGRIMNKDPSTVFRWRAGIKVRDGRERLVMFRIGGRWMVRPHDLADFLRRLNPDSHEPAAAVETPAARGSAGERAGRELDRIGIR
jgi:hypothetical protein